MELLKAHPPVPGALLRRPEGYVLRARPALEDQQLAGAILVILTATIVVINFFTDIILALLDPRVRQGLIG